ncbi:MAG: hypothetical protein ACM3UZ_04540 [Acidobacteriota bacterium]
MRRYVHILLIVIVVICFAGCDNNDSSDQQGSRPDVNLDKVKSNVYRGSPGTDKIPSDDEIVVDSKTNPPSAEMEGVYKDIDKEIQGLMTDLDSLESSGGDKELEKIEKEGQL